jgi:hypothetical protein
MNRPVFHEYSAATILIAKREDPEYLRMELFHKLHSGIDRRYTVH